MDTNGAVLFPIFTNELVLAQIILTAVYSFTLFLPFRCLVDGKLLHSLKNETTGA